jgi:type IV pilus assembly protein PilN
MIEFNLLPWREAQRREQKRLFNGLLVLSALCGLIVVLIVSAVNAAQVSIQNGRNALLQSENKILDNRLREIKGLREDINALKARQYAVESLQSDRARPVHLLDELATRVPSGVALKSIKQNDHLVLIGLAQSNARVSEFLRNLSQSSPWFGKAELVEIKAASLGQGKEARKVYEFNVTIAAASVTDRP